jgi:uncharacterized protein
MSDRDGYAPGVPCWVASVHRDPESVVGFYIELFGWRITEAGGFFMCSTRGRRVAAIGRGDTPPTWLTLVCVERADDAVERAMEAGGEVILRAHDLVGLGRAALLADPAGAVFGVWEPGPHRGAEAVNEPGAWALSQLNTPDVEGAKGFYGAVFGWGTDTFDLGDVQISLWRLPGYLGGEPQQPVPRDVVGAMAPAADGGPAAWGVDFRVRDVDATAALAARLGGRSVAPAFDTPVGRTAVIADPQGAVFSVSRVAAS